MPHCVGCKWNKYVDRPRHLCAFEESAPQDSAQSCLCFTPLTLVTALTVLKPTMNGMAAYETGQETEGKSLHRGQLFG